MRWVTAFLVSCTLVAVIGLATSAQAAPAMFQASFIFHAWGNDISGGATHRSAMPLGYGQEAEGTSGHRHVDAQLRVRDAAGDPPPAVRHRRHRRGLPTRN
jgi:hypothetical protein